MRLTTSLNNIYKFSPCTDGWRKAVKHVRGLNLSHSDPFTYDVLLESNGLDDVVWALRAVHQCSNPELLRKAIVMSVKLLEFLHTTYAAKCQVGGIEFNNVQIIAAIDKMRAVADGSMGYVVFDRLFQMPATSIKVCHGNSITSQDGWEFYCHNLLRGRDALQESLQLTADLIRDVRCTTTVSDAYSSNVWRRFRLITCEVDSMVESDWPEAETQYKPMLAGIVTELIMTEYMESPTCA